MRGLMILAVAISAAACTSSPPTAQLAQNCQLGPDGTQICQPASPTPVSYQKNSQRYSAR